MYRVVVCRVSVFLWCACFCVCVLGLPGLVQDVLCMGERREGEGMLDAFLFLLFVSPPVVCVARVSYGAWPRLAQRIPFSCGLCAGRVQMLLMTRQRACGRATAVFFRMMRVRLARAPFLAEDTCVFCPLWRQRLVCISRLLSRRCDVKTFKGGESRVIYWLVYV